MEFRFRYKYENGKESNGGTHICPNLDEAIGRATMTIHTHNQANATQMSSIEVWHKDGMDEVLAVATGTTREVESYQKKDAFVLAVGILFGQIFELMHGDPTHLHGGVYDEGSECCVGLHHTGTDNCVHFYLDLSTGETRARYLHFRCFEVMTEQNGWIAREPVKGLQCESYVRATYNEELLETGLAKFVHKFLTDPFDGQTWCECE